MESVRKMVSGFGYLLGVMLMTWGLFLMLLVGIGLTRWAYAFAGFGK